MEKEIKVNNNQQITIFLALLDRVDKMQRKIKNLEECIDFLQSQEIEVSPSYYEQIKGYKREIKEVEELIEYWKENL